MNTQEVGNDSVSADALARVAELQRKIAELGYIAQLCTDQKTTEQIEADKAKYRALVNQMQELYSGLPDAWKQQLAQMQAALSGSKQGKVSTDHER